MIAKLLKITSNKSIQIMLVLIKIIKRKIISCLIFRLVKTINHITIFILL
jgi:hypothetical protein